ncbi:MAG: hypothetical protein IPQ09_11290 [Myxococcales bacterium]|nr:hypothetical protein [Myxococcales bacterium]HQY63552.1 hypothetical protein [Polyangiaceae bacterium]
MSRVAWPSALASAAASVSSVAFAFAFAFAPLGCSSTAPPSSDPVDAGLDAAPLEGVADAGREAGLDAGADAATPSSGGTGGLACTRRDALDPGHTVCVLKIGGTELKVVEPAAGAGPLVLALYLHGDGAGAHKSGSALRTMAPWLDAARGLGVSVLAPNGCSWWQSPSHDCASAGSTSDRAADNTKALAGAFEALGRAYDLRTDRTYYYGSSGGSIFLTEQWLPLEGGRHPGVFALMCGGEATTRAFAWDPASATRRSRFGFTYGDQDFLKKDIEGAARALRDKGLDVNERVLPGAAHCAFDAHGEAVSVWSAAP